MLHQEKENLIQRGINPFISPEIGRYDMTGIVRDVTPGLAVCHSAAHKELPYILAHALIRIHLRSFAVRFLLDIS